MLPAAHRMRSAADFSDTTRRGAKASRGSVVVYAHRSDADVPALVGLTVGRAVGGSVSRHRASRRIRGAMAGLLGTVPRGTRIVIRALPGADVDAELSANLAVALEHALARATGRVG